MSHLKVEYQVEGRTEYPSGSVGEWKQIGHSHRYRRDAEDSAVLCYHARYQGPEASRRYRVTKVTTEVILDASGLVELATENDRLKARVAELEAEQAIGRQARRDMAERQARSLDPC